jgi:hypothetical protein
MYEGFVDMTGMRFTTVMEAPSETDGPSLTLAESAAQPVSGAEESVDIRSVMFCFSPAVNVVSSLFITCAVMPLPAVVSKVRAVRDPPP